MSEFENNDMDMLIKFNHQTQNSICSAYGSKASIDAQIALLLDVHRWLNA